jgi:homopolymeric O-antigen transport system ATP-binding protein
MNDAVIRFEHVSKRFRRGNAHDSLRDLLGGGIRRLMRRSRPAQDDSFLAMDDVCFETFPGEAVGLIGANGAGKSTALKLAARILRPDGGTVSARGRLTALIEINAGFHGDLTGRENIYMNGAILGMRKSEIDRKLDAIVDFTGIPEFIDTPVKRYSSGMQARLGFSVAAHVDPDVMLIDEVLSVGDVMFRQRCLDRMRELVESGASLLFVSHNLEQIQAFCTRTVVLDRGRVVFDGDTGGAAAKYIESMQRNVTLAPVARSNKPGTIETVRVRNEAGQEVQAIRPDEPITVDVAFHLSQPIERLSVEIEIRRAHGVSLANLSSVLNGVTFAADAGPGTVTASLPSLPVGGGQYLFRVLLQDADTTKVVAHSDYGFPLFVGGDGRSTGILCLPHKWSEVSKVDKPQAAAQLVTV